MRKAQRMASENNEMNESERAAGVGNDRVKRILLTAAIIVVSLCILALLSIFYLAPALLPWSSTKQVIDPTAMLGFYKPAEAMRQDMSLLDGSYSTDDPAWGDDEIFALLIIGNDYDYSRSGARASGSPGRADTIMLLLMPKDKMSATIVSIPRDTMVTNAYGSSYVKINSLYRGSPPDSLMRKVAELTGIKVDRWLSMDFAGFEYLVDLLGGVDITVTKRMKYTDRAGGYQIDLQPGSYHFNGEEALTYVRYRSDALGDIARVERQLGFVKALAGRAATWNTAGKLFGLFYVANEYLSTDINLGEAIAIGARLIKIGQDKVDYWKMPGSFNGTFWQLDVQELHSKLKTLGSAKAK